MAMIMVLLVPMSSFAAVRVTLDVKDYKESSSAKVLREDRAIGSGAMTFSIPSTWKSVEKPLDNIDGYRYMLNEIPKELKSDTEELFVFYFSNERYLDDLRNADDREAIEKAIVTNILPEEHMIGLNIIGVTFPTARLNPKGWELFTIDKCYDYFDTRYKDKNGKVHNAEFVFYPNGKKGMCCALYVYTESVHKDDIIYLLRNIKTKEK